MSEQPVIPENIEDLELEETDVPLLENPYADGSGDSDDGSDLV